MSINPKVSFSERNRPTSTLKEPSRKERRRGDLLDNHEDFYLTYNHRRLSITGRCFQETN